MKKALTFLLLSLYLFSATDFKELLKVNVLVEHFYETRKTEPVSFCGYLVEHYVTDDHNNKDNDRDRQLPFQTQDKLVSNPSFVYIPNTVLHFAFQPFPVKNTPSVRSNDSFVCANYQSLAWHPPKFC